MQTDSQSPPRSALQRRTISDEKRLDDVHLLTRVVQTRLVIFLDQTRIHSVDTQFERVVENTRLDLQQIALVSRPDAPLFGTRLARGRDARVRRALSRSLPRFRHVDDVQGAVQIVVGVVVVVAAETNRPLLGRHFEFHVRLSVPSEEKIRRFHVRVDSRLINVNRAERRRLTLETDEFDVVDENRPVAHQIDRHAVVLEQKVFRTDASVHSAGNIFRENSKSIVRLAR